MKLLIDSANVEDIRQAASWGILDGVTTNPSLMAQCGVGSQGQAFEEVLLSICGLVSGPVSAECMETQTRPMILEAQRLAALHPNIVVKVPLTMDGLRCVQALSGMGIPTNVTLCFSTAQGLLAAKAGATYISPFVGRLDDLAHEGMQVVKELVTIYRHYQWPTQVLAASIRHPRHVVEAALAGAHAATVPYKILAQLVQHPLTDHGLQKFLDDGRRSPHL